MMGKDHIAAGARPYRKSFSRAGLPLKCRLKSGRMQVNAGQSQHSSTFVNFFRRVAPWPNPLIPLGKMGIQQRSCQRQAEKAHPPFFTCLYRNMEDGHSFRESKTVHSWYLHAKARNLRHPETDTYSVMNSVGKVFRLPLISLILEEATS